MASTLQSPAITGEPDLLTVAKHVRDSDFESVYAEAAGDVTRVPWADMRPHPALVTWLNAAAPGLVRCGGRVIVVGCGLGDDVREIARRGYEVIGFDCSRTAIEWASSRDPDHADVYQVADLFNLPSRWRHRFDLVVEINTLQSLPISRRTDAVRALRELLSPHGCLLVICRGTLKPAREEDGPPWPLTEDDLRKSAALAGLTPASPITSFMDNEDPPVVRIRGVFRKAQ